MPSIDLGKVVGDQGPKGDTGPKGDQGIQGQQGIQGPAGEGVPAGGSTGLFLMKKSGTDYDTEWADPTTKVKQTIGIVEEGNTATQIISKGQYVIWKGSLYTADSTISSGTTLASSGGSKNLSAVANGGLNSVYDNINNKMTKVRYYTNAAVVSTEYSLMVISITVNFSDGVAETDISAIIRAGGYTGSVASCFAIMRSVPATSVITACSYSSSSYKVTLSAKSTVDGSATNGNAAVAILVLVS